MNKDVSGRLRLAVLFASLFAAHCGGENPSQGSAAATSSTGSGGPLVGAVAGATGTSTQPKSASANSVGAAGRGATQAMQAAQGTQGASAVAGMTATTAVAGSGAAGVTAGRASAAGASGAGATAGMGAAVAPMGAGTWPTADIGADGPFKQMTMTNIGPNNGYQLSFPTDLGRDGLKHPIVTWGNGSGSTPNQYTLLQRMATHGFVVIASNSSSVTAALLKGGIDWLIMENGRDGSMFKDKLDPNQVAAMGFSLGSLATFEAATDMRIKTTVHISGGSMNKSVVANLHGPAAFYCGTSDDIAFSGCEGDFEITKVPTIYANFPGDHLGVRNAATAPMIAKATVGWLRWRLMGDKSLDSMFVGADCALCKDSAWEKVQQKMLDVPPP